MINTNQATVNKRPRRTSDPVKVLGILSLIFGCIGLVFLLLSLGFYSWTNFFSTTTSQTEGTVTGIVYRVGTANNPVAPVVQYSVNNQNYTHNSSVYSSAVKYKIGDKLVVHYDPNKPQDSRLDFEAAQLLAVIFLIIGLGFIVVSGILGFIRRSMSQKQRKLISA